MEIKGLSGGRGNTYKYVAADFNHKLTWTDHILSLMDTLSSRLYFVKKMQSTKGYVLPFISQAVRQRNEHLCVYLMLSDYVVVLNGMVICYISACNYGIRWMHVYVQSSFIHGFYVGMTLSVSTVISIFMDEINFT